MSDDRLEQMKKAFDWMVDRNCEYQSIEEASSYPGSKYDVNDVRIAEDQFDRAKREFGIVLAASRSKLGDEWGGLMEEFMSWALDNHCGKDCEYAKKAIERQGNVDSAAQEVADHLQGNFHQYFKIDVNRSTEEIHLEFIEERPDGSRIVSNDPDYHEGLREHDRPASDTR